MPARALLCAMPRETRPRGWEQLPDERTPRVPDKLSGFTCCRSNPDLWRCFVPVRLVPILFLECSGRTSAASFAGEGHKDQKRPGSPPPPRGPQQPAPAEGAEPPARSPGRGRCSPGPACRGSPALARWDPLQTPAELRWRLKVEKRKRWR